MDERKKRGDRGEDAVAAALARKGFRLLERQYRCRWGEIDLIVRSPEGTVCFVEVKTRSPRAPGGRHRRQAAEAAGRRVLVPLPDGLGWPLPVRCGGGIPGGRRGPAADQVYYKRVLTGRIFGG